MGTQLSRLHSLHGCKPRQDGKARLTAPSSLVPTPSPAQQDSIHQTEPRTPFQDPYPNTAFSRSIPEHRHSNNLSGHLVITGSFTFSVAV